MAQQRGTTTTTTTTTHRQRHGGQQPVERARPQGMHVILSTEAATKNEDHLFTRPDLTLSKAVARSNAQALLLLQQRAQAAAVIPQIEPRYKSGIPSQGNSCSDKSTQDKLKSS